MSKRLAYVLMGTIGFLMGIIVSSQTGVLQAQGAKEEEKKPVWSHAYELKVRKTGEQNFTADTKKVAIEVFKDAANGNIIYITEGGAIAVVKP